MIDWSGEAPLDRCEPARSDLDWVAAQWSDPAAVVVPLDDEGRIAAEADQLAYRTPAGEFDAERHYLVGRLDARPVFAAAEVELGNSVPLRSIMDGLPPGDLQVAFAAAGLVGWHHTARHCGRCGARTLVRAGGYSRHCLACGREWFPRTDPAVIVAILDADDRLLLGRQPVWPERRMSVFAGFVETGESLEQAIHREIAEEVGLAVERLGYLGSQPWPFPRSLMVAFAAHTRSTGFTLDVTEIEHARWFERGELDRAVDTGEVLLPAATSIAHRMISAWQQGRLTGGS